MAPPPDQQEHLVWRVLRWLAVGVFAIGLVRTAWVDEDAFITFRTIENFFNGHGLRWNPAERVQTFTHPLWMGLLSIGHWLSGEYYYTALTLGALCTAAALFGIGYRVNAGIAGGACALFILAFSKSFVNFSTSGLEAPLTHLLLAIFAYLHFSDAPREKRLLHMALVTALATVNRLDTLLLFGPALLVACRGMPPRAAIKSLALGFSPLFAWVCFATFYYGTPIPISGYSKALAGIPQGALFAQGLHYYSDVATRDPVVLPALVLALVAALRQRCLRSAGLALGVVLYCAYVLKIGGGYMSGRFLTPPLFVAAILIARSVYTPRWKWLQPVLLLVTVGLGFACPTTPILISPDYNTRGEGVPVSGVTDECGFWYYRTGLLSKSRDIPEPDSLSKITGFELDPSAPLLFLDAFVGLDGFMAGEGLHIVDPILCDPLLMRLPSWGRDRKKWRVGHYLRQIPDGYLESVQFNQNLIRHPGLARSYQDLRLITRAPLFNPQRLKAIWSLAFGAGQQGLQQYRAEAYRQLLPKTVSDSALPAPCEDGTSIWDPAFKIVGKGGVLIRLAKTSHEQQVTLGLGGKTEYSIAFMQGDRELALVTHAVAFKGKLFPGVLATPIQVPAEASQVGYDHIMIKALGFRRSGIHCVAYIQ